MKGNGMQGKQRGMTLMSFLIGMVVACFFVYMGMILGPAYSEYFGVKKAMNSVAAAQSANEADQGKISRALDKQFNIGYVNSVAGKEVKLVRQRGGNLIVADYEVRKGFIYNIDFVVKFKYQTPLGGKSSGSG